MVANKVNPYAGYYKIGTWTKKNPVSSQPLIRRISLSSDWSKLGYVNDVYDVYIAEYNLISDSYTN